MSHVAFDCIDRSMFCVWDWNCICSLGYTVKMSGSHSWEGNFPTWEEVLLACCAPQYLTAREFCQLWLAQSQERTFIGITGVEFQTKWQSMFILPSFYSLPSLSLSLSILSLSFHCTAPFAHSFMCAKGSLLTSYFLFIFLKPKKTLFPALSFCWKRMLSSIQHYHKL